VSLIAGVEPLPFDEIRLGQVFQTSETFGYAAMDHFAALTGDRSAIHVDGCVARECGFPDRLQYGFLLAGLLSRIVGTNFHKAVCAAVSLDFINPVPAGTRVDVNAEVMQIQDAMRSVALRITMASEAKVVVRGKLTTIFLREDKGMQ
jgi:acyl dehydratase